MLLPPFDQAQQFFRGNLHGHSTHSDGVTSAAAVVEAYASLGYDFTCLSDHLWKKTWFSADTVLDTADLMRDDFITIPSAELHCLGKKYDQDGLWHIVANGLPLDFKPADDDETGPQLVQRAIDAGAYVTIAHPEWYSMTTDEAESIAHAHGVEVYNHSCAVSSNRGSGIAVADQLLNEGHRISFTATDDSHFQPRDHGGGWVMVAADDLTPNAIVTALKQGRHYSSTGPVINYLTYEDGTLIVDCSAAEAIMVSAQGHLALNQTGPNLTYAEFDLSGLKTSYFRVTILDRACGMAWSNPYFLDDLTS